MITALPKTFEEGIRSVHRKPEMALGEYYHSNDLAIHTSYVRFAEDVEVGDAVRTKFDLMSPKTLAADAAGNFPQVGSTQIAEADATYLETLKGIPTLPTYRDYAEIAFTGDHYGILQEYTDKILHVLWFSSAAATKGQFLDGGLTQALDGSVAYTITAPWYVEKIDSKGVVNGVSLVKAKKDEYGLIIWCGDDFVKTAQADAVGTPLFADDATGTARGGGYKHVSGILDPPYATVRSASSINGIARAQIYCKPISILPELPRGQDRGFKRPGA